MSIVFIAKYPVGNLQKDGASIRIIAIDEIFSETEKIYVESFNFPIHNFIYFLIRDIKRKYYKYIAPDTEKRVNYKFLNRKKTIELFESCKYIYIESFPNLAKLDLNLIKKYGYKMILDFHGCVIEEMEMMKVPFWKKYNMQFYEQCALKHIKTFVAVSQNMIDFYKNKYQECHNANFIKLPIYNSNEIKASNKSNDMFNVIYSGRNYIWQNTELMVKSIAQIIDKNKSANNIKFTILSPDISTFQKLLKENNIDKKVVLKSVNPEDLNEEYKSAHYGFILRDKDVVNTVACPTKLIEYMSAGIIPIVLQPEIGDFNQLGYEYLLNSDFINLKLPNLQEAEQMRQHNYKIIKSFNSEIMYSQKQLIDLYRNN